MIIEALVSQYDYLMKNKKTNDLSLLEYGYTPEKFGCSIHLTSNGEFIGILDERDNKEPRFKKAPANCNKTSGIKSNYLYDNLEYVLGLEKSNKPFTEYIEQRIISINDNKEINIAKTKKSLSKQKAFIDNLGNSKEEMIIKDFLINKGSNINFFNDSDLLILTSHDFNIEFYIDGNRVLENELINEYWLKKKEEEKSDIIKKCLICNKENPIAKLHPPIKGAGFEKATPKLISYNFDSVQKHDNQGTLNSPICEDCVHKYTQMLNYLVSSPNNHFKIDDLLIVYFCREKENEEFFHKTMKLRKNRNQADEKTINELFKRGLNYATDFNINLNSTFYIIGITANGARLSIQFFHKDNFGKILENMINYYNSTTHETKEGFYYPDIRDIADIPNYKKNGEKLERIRDSKILKEDLLKLYKHIILGKPFPSRIFKITLNKIMNDGIITSTRKSVLLNHCLYKKEDKEYNMDNIKSKAYYLGQLLMLIEATQIEASDSNLNTTIGNKYLNIFLRTPQLGFIQTMKFQKIYMSKLTQKNKSYAINKDKLIQDTLNNLGNHIPEKFNNSEKAEFLLGYCNKSILYQNNKEKGE